MKVDEFRVQFKMVEKQQIQRKQKRIHSMNARDCLNIALMGLILNIKPHLQGQDIFFQCGEWTSADRFSSVRKTAYQGKHWEGLSKYNMKVTSYEEKTDHLS